MSEIDWADEVVELRRRFHEHRRAVEAGDRSAERRAAIRKDADVLAVCLEESADSTGSWTRLYDAYIDLLRSWN
jgi:hypothetical protein